MRRSTDESDEESSGTDDAPPGPEPAPREWGAPWASSSDSSQYTHSSYPYIANQMQKFIVSARLRARLLQINLHDNEAYYFIRSNT